MGSKTPKQFLLVRGKPLLMWTFKRFYKFDPRIKIILALPQDKIAYWEKLCRKYAFDIPHTIAVGGKTRFESVRNALQQIEADDDALVAVHDGVRPLVSEEVIKDCFLAASAKRAAIPVCSIVETIREVSRDFASSHTVDRDKYRIVQTPQTFQLGLLRKAYAQPYNDSFTDDASVVEALGVDVFLLEGNRENIKVTTPVDLKIAKALLS